MFSAIKQFLFGFIKLALISALVIGVLGLIFLDRHITAEFEGKRWALPAKVFARPLELFVGAQISIEELKIELEGLGYQTVEQVDQAGQVQFDGGKVLLHSRGFQFSDGYEPARLLEIDFSKQTITALNDSNGQAIALVRLEPMLIDGIYPLNNEDRDLVKISEVPPQLLQALIAIEDRAYYDHYGISIRGIARAMWANIKARRFVQGGSTLTQQLIKNFYLTSDRTLSRKLLEMPMAVLLELHYSKEEILEAYLNEVYAGQQGKRAIHGFGLAAQYYFGQPLRELKLPQLAFLAGLVKGPSSHNPRKYPEKALARRDLVLKVMHEQELIDETTYQQAIATPLDIVEQASLHKGAYPAYLDLVKRQLREEYPEDALRTEGLRIFTSLDPISQTKAEKALTQTIEALEKRHGERVKDLQGSMVVTDPQTGEILAIIGGRETRYKGFNRALDTQRPIGSLVKPAVYLTALMQGYHLASLLDDSPYVLTMPNGQVWEPKNFDQTSHADVQLHHALARSYNQSTARLGMEIGVENVITTLGNMGVDHDFDPYPSLLLGAQGLAPIDVAVMYQTIASNGFQIPLRAIRQVTDSQSKELSRYPFDLEQTLDAENLHLLQYALQEVTRIGTARSIYNKLDKSISVAGKTGTSDLQRDSWFAGFAGNRLAVVWLGLDDNKPLPFTGASGALRVWTGYMSNETLQPFIATKPENIEYRWIDEKNGLLSDARCPHAQQLPFIDNNYPDRFSNCGESSAPTLTQPTPNAAPAESENWFQRWFN